jgi:CubicO group peptidase (beta-lactamase class C family)
VTLSRRALFAAPLLALDKPQLAPAEKLLNEAVSSGQLRAAVLHVEQGAFQYEKAFGAAKANTPFLIASISKPMTATAVMTLVERGDLKLDEPANQYLPGLNPRITLRHLLSHSSGLPDMLPDNIALRERHAPLSEFAAKAVATPWLFDPGTKVSYQSMGILLAATIAERVTKQTFPQLLDQQVFAPLGMKDSVLGLGRRLKIANTAQCQVEHADPPGPSSWDWNSEYWRNLGAPWGGVHSTAADVSKFIRYFMYPRGKPLAPATATQMVTRQSADPQAYGLGWAIQAEGFGHGGSTGTLSMAYPALGLSFVLLTTLPSKVSQKTILDPVLGSVRASAR